MKIESIIRRAGGTKLSIGKNDYHFAENEDGRHVCEVADENHADRLLSIKEGFRLVDEQDQSTDPDLGGDIENSDGQGEELDAAALDLPVPVAEEVAEEVAVAAKPGRKAKAA